MPDFTIKRDSTLPPLEVQLVSATGARIDVSLANVRFRMRKKGSAINIVDQAVTVIDAVQGRVSYLWQLVDTVTPGDYEGEFEVTYPDTNNRKLPSSKFLAIKITDSLD